jgi:ligand-binding SRPBCC domain-containing protein
MGFNFQSEQWVPYPAETVFAFFANPENLPVLMPKWQNTRLEQVTIVAPPRVNATTPMAGSGSRITLSLRPFHRVPFRVRWESEITDFVLNSHFTDHQVKGPFAFWSHTHRIRSVDRAGINITVIIDQVEYEPPMGFLGRIAHSLFLRKQLERTFAHRQVEVTKLLAQLVQVTPELPQKLSKLA